MTSHFSKRDQNTLLKGSYFQLQYRAVDKSRISALHASLFIAAYASTPQSRRACPKETVILFPFLKILTTKKTNNGTCRLLKHSQEGGGVPRTAIFTSSVTRLYRVHVSAGLVPGFFNRLLKGDQGRGIPQAVSTELFRNPGECPG